MQTEETYQPGKMRENFSSKSERNAAIPAGDGKTHPPFLDQHFPNQFYG
jgi:hypothetical protein